MALHPPFALALAPAPARMTPDRVFLETMGASRLSGAAQARRHGRGSVEHQQVGPWSVAVFNDADIGNRATIAFVH